MISQFKDQYSFLSNFYSSEIEYMGILYSTVEHAFQASKTGDSAERYQIAMLGTPGEAKRRGRMVSLRDDWDIVKIPIMSKLVSLKFQNLILKQQLLDTGDQILQEGNYWQDTFWGVNLETGVGNNHLGKILMNLRETISYAKS